MCLAHCDGCETKKGVKDFVAAVLNLSHGNEDGRSVTKCGSLVSKAQKVFNPFRNDSEIDVWIYDTFDYN